MGTCAISANVISYIVVFDVTSYFLYQQQQQQRPRKKWLRVYWWHQNKQIIQWINKNKCASAEKWR